MIMNGLTVTCLVSALAAAAAWYRWQVWQSKQAAALAATLPPRFRALGDLPPAKHRCNEDSTRYARRLKKPLPK